MRRVGTTLAAALAFGLAPACAVAGASDIGATHAYIQANLRRAQAGIALIKVAQARIEQLNARLARDCPLAASGSPQNEASQPLAGLVVVEEWSIAYGTNSAPLRSFARVVKGLRWSNPAITRSARSYARSLLEMAALAKPDLCQVIGAWKESAFQVAPAGVVSLVRHAEAIELHPVSSRLLARFARGADAGMLAQTQRLEAKLADAEFENGVHDTFQLLDTLALNE